MDIGSAFSEFAARAALLSVIVSALLTVLKLSGVARRLTESKWLARLACVVLVAVGSAFHVWQETGQFTWDVWGPIFWQALLGAEFSYQWLLKYLEKMSPPTAEEPVRCGRGLLDALDGKEAYGV